jgi:hypothetical protein
MNPTLSPTGGHPPLPYQLPESARPVPAPVRPPWWHRRVLLLLAGGAAAVVVGGVVLTSDREADMTVEFTLVDPGGGSDCSGGAGGYSDIRPGMPLTVRDQDGGIIGSGSLGSGWATDLTGGGCVWRSIITAVPTDAEHYVIEGGSRGEVVFPHDQLADNGWVAELTIGE